MTNFLKSTVEEKIHKIVDSLIICFFLNAKDCFKKNKYSFQL